MRYPLQYIGITQGFHVGKCLDFGWNDKYGGKNQPIYACDDGVVYKVEVQPNGGNVIYIKHDKGIVSCYAHLSKVLVKKGQKVKMGKQIGNMGDTGKGTNGNHLHFGLFTSTSVIYKNSTIDPFEYLELYEGQIVSGNTKEKYGSKIKVHVDSKKGKVKSSDGLNLREGNSTDYNILALLSDKTEVEILDEKDGWYKVKIVGYASGNYIDNSKVKSSDGLNLREGNSTKDKILALMNDNTKVSVKDNSKGWDKVELVGWVSKNYID